MNAGPLVSVIIPCYNAARFVRDAVVSALSQTYRSLEIIVINDGSTDDTEGVLQPYSGQIHYYRQPNHGLSITRNRAITLARGELIAFLDADDIWFPEKLARQVQCLRQDPKIGLVHTNYAKLYAATGKLETRQPHNFTVGNCYARLALGNVVQVSSVVLRRECLDKVGRFDDKIPRRTCEDYDLWLRMARHFDFAYIPEPLMLYRRHAANMSNNTQAMTQDEAYVLQKALKADPSLAAQTGAQATRERLANLLFSVGYHFFDDGDLSQAGPNLRHALRFRHSPYIFMLWAATFLPKPVVSRLRRFKQSFGDRSHPALAQRLWMRFEGKGRPSASR
jgi:glycosyltransferase involved in cell wall biosynthesis